MDLVSTVRKEGSRGGRGDFAWSDVQTSSHRENYLGHSLMAPVGRWQKGRDLNWYAKSDADKKDGNEDPAEKAARERKEEIRKIKDAEQDALARALGFDVAPRNPNMELLGDKREVDKILKEAAGDEEGEGGKGVGYGAFGGAVEPGPSELDDRIEGSAEKQDTELRNALREYRRRHGDDGKRRSRRRSRSGDRERRHERKETRHQRHRSRSREPHRRRNSSSKLQSRENDRRRVSRSRSRGQDERAYERRGERRNRSLSPYSRDDRKRNDGYPRHHRRDEDQRDQRR